MSTEKIEWVSKLGLLASLRTQLEQLLKVKQEGWCKEAAGVFTGRMKQLQMIIEEIERL